MLENPQILENGYWMAQNSRMNLSFCMLVEESVLPDLSKS